MAVRFRLTPLDTVIINYKELTIVLYAVESCNPKTGLLF